MHNFSAFKGISSFVFVIAFGFYQHLKAQTPEILYYKFNGTGNSVPNLALYPPSGTENATINGSQTQGDVGQSGGALVGFSGNSNVNFVNTNWAPDIGNSSWTIAFWSNNIDQSGEISTIFGDVNTGSLRCFTGGVAGSGNWMMRGPVSDIIAVGGASTGPSITAFVYDKDSSTIKSYVNGVLSQTVSQSTLDFTGSGPFKIGGYNIANALKLNNAIDEFRLYNRALSIEEINTFDTLVAAINLVGTLQDFEACPNTASNSQPLKIVGHELTDFVTLTASENFEVSTDAQNDFGSSVNISPTDGAVSQTIVYVRLAANVIGAYTGNLILTSEGAETIIFELGGETAQCPPPVAKCFSNTININVNPSHLVYNGSGAADVYKVNSILLDNGSTSESPATREVARLTFPVSSSSSASSVFNWTTNGICTDVNPSGGITDEDKGYSWESCLAITPADFNKVRNYKLKVTNSGGSSSCSNGKYKIIYSSNPQSPEFSIIKEELTQTDNNNIINVYPNPGSNNLYIDVNIDFKTLENYSMSILDILGKEVKSISKLDSSFYEIDATNFVSGTYSIIIKSSENIYTSRWIKL